MRLYRTTNRSLPGSTRQSIQLQKAFAKQMDARVISAFTRVHSPSKTGVNALIDALLPAHDADRRVVQRNRDTSYLRTLGETYAAPIGQGHFFSGGFAELGRG